MHLQEQYQEDSNSITHSPYYGCTVQAISKAHISYEGILDGISTNKDRIFLKNVRVKGNTIDASIRDDSIEELDTINTVMIDHLTNDMSIYQQVCLNVRDIQELKLIRLPSTFHESKAKLRAIDPCLVDIRLSPSDEHERMSNDSSGEHSQPAPIARRSRGESFGSNGGSAQFSCSSNESSPPLSYLPNESLDEQIKQFSQLSTSNVTQKPATLLAKKVLPKKPERNHVHPLLPQNSDVKVSPVLLGSSNPTKKSAFDPHRKSSPIRVTIVSNLNPNATPFYAEPRSIRPNTNSSSLKFYQRNPFQPIFTPNDSQAVPNRMNTNNVMIQQQQQNQHRSYQRFVPPRQMAAQKKFNNQASTGASHMRSNTIVDKPLYGQKPSDHKKINHPHIAGPAHQVPSQSSALMDQIISTPPMRERLSMPIQGRQSRPPATLQATNSLPYQKGQTVDRSQFPTHMIFSEPIGSHRGPRTVSGTSSGSSLSVDIGPHLITQLDSPMHSLTSEDGQYDFERANQEFRRYLALEELVARHVSPDGSISPHMEEISDHQQALSNSYKKEISFFDRISCTATTGTAVAYTEVDEVEKNRETFGDDAMLIKSKPNDNEWFM